MLRYMLYAFGDLTTWQWTKTTLYRTLKENKTATQDAQQHRKIQLFTCVAAIAVCLAQKSWLIIWTIIILGLIVWRWKIWPHNCLHVSHRPSSGLAWPNPWRQRGHAECIASFSSTQEPFRPLTFALVVYLMPVSSLLGSDRRRADSATCSQERWCSFLCLGGVESISLGPSVTLNVRRETANPWSSVTQVLNVARPCRWRM